jgi:hypothetical protein
MAMVGTCALLMIMMRRYGSPYLWLALAAVTGPVVMFLMSWAAAGIMLKLPGKAVRKVVLKTVIPVLLLCAVCATIALLPARAGRRRAALRAQCAERLRAIHQACDAYERTEIKRPESLQALVDAGLLDKDYVHCPARGPDEPGYIFVPCAVVSANTSTDRIRVCDRRGNHRAGRLVLFANGRPALLSEQDFQVLLKEPINAALAEAVKADEAGATTQP